MTEKTTLKRANGRTLVTVLAITHVVLLASLVGTIAIYFSAVNDLQAQLAEKDSVISSLNSQLSSIENSLFESRSGNLAKDSQIASLQNIINLNLSEVLVNNQHITQDANTSTYFVNNTIKCAGYVSVNVQSSTDTAYIELAYSSYGVNYDNKITVGTNGTAVFPVLPPLIEIRFGNTNPVETANATITAIYYY
jgi:hypothetical protein